jgi:acetyl-CoA/propionyl-CoA carboxylase biotin carboxyl carrier protein
MSGALFESVLIANRGEIAVRVARTLRELGIRSVAVYTAVDAGALHTQVADERIAIGSYLSVDDVIEATSSSGAKAIHPGYGFLSENPRLARACAESGIVFVGPPPEAIEAMGDKIAAKAMVAAAGVPVVPGSTGAGLDDTALTEAALAIGFPVLVKPSAGGGGKGMHLVERADQLATALSSARREAEHAFGDATLLIERFVRGPRHIEIQVLADTHGNVVHLGERECSLQRRHQKIVEEAPSVLLDAAQRAAMGEQAVAAGKACGYAGAGTVEFIVESASPERFYFMEMNTRLQVEHPVTEMVYGVDLVEQQLRVAAGEVLQLRQPELQPRGHAVEVRVYAEDPSRGFLPTGGRVLALHLPGGDGVRVDSGIAAGSMIGSDYDPMLAKVIAWGDDRTQAIDRLDGALSELAVLGVTTNTSFLRRLLADPDVRSGAIDTGLVERKLDSLVISKMPDAVLAAAAIASLQHERGDAWSNLTGWRLGRARPAQRRLTVGTVEHVVRVAPAPDGWVVGVDGREPVPATFRSDGDSLLVTLDGVEHRLFTARRGDELLLGLGGETWSIAESDTVRSIARAGAAGDGAIRSPMPGRVVAVTGVAGDHVDKGATLVVVEAMKMEHALTAPFAGVVGEVLCESGAAVALDQLLLTIEHHPADQGEQP